MKHQFKLLRQTRKNFLNTIKDYSFQELSKIPKGFNNNIVWNFNHTIVCMAILVYKFSGNEMPVNNEIVSKYSKGTSPKEDNTKEDFEYCKSLAIELVNQLEKDYNNNKFQYFKEYSTSYNFTLNNIEDAILFNNIHESLHFGYAMSQIKTISL